MALPQPQKLTVEEYLALDLDTDFRYEFVAGEIIAMAGASREHNIIAVNVSTSLNTQLQNRDCELYQSDMRVQVKANNIYRYPDISIVCEPPQFADTNPESLINPTLLIEILSSSTATTDRIEKLNEYRRIASSREYVLISIDQSRIERYLKQDDINWLYTDISGIDQSLELPSIDCILKFRDAYRRIEFET